MAWDWAVAKCVCVIRSIRLCWKSVPWMEDDCGWCSGAPFNQPSSQCLQTLSWFRMNWSICFIVSLYFRLYYLNQISHWLSPKAAAQSVMSPWSLFHTFPSVCTENKVKGYKEKIKTCNCIKYGRLKSTPLILCIFEKLFECETIGVCMWVYLIECITQWTAFSTDAVLIQCPSCFILAFLHLLSSLKPNPSEIEKRKA